MKFSIPINLKKAKFILSCGEDNFKEVFQDRGEHLYITSFNHNIPNFHNNGILNQLEYMSNIIVVFNLSDDSIKINKLITRALKKNPYIQFFFCKNNHSKIISNGRKMYVGSAGATDISQNYLEAGVIIEDKQTVTQIEHEIFGKPYLKYEPIFTDPIYPLLLPLLFILDEMELGYAYSSFINDIPEHSNFKQDTTFDHMDYLENSLKRYLKTFQSAKREMINYGKEKPDFYIIEHVLDCIEDSLKSLLTTSLNSLKEEKERKNYFTKGKAISGLFQDLRMMWISTFPQNQFIGYSLGVYSIALWSELPDLSKRYWMFFLNKSNKYKGDEINWESYKN